MKPNSANDRKQPRYSRRFLSAWIAALVCIFCASAGLVMARGTLIRRQTDELERTVARGPHVLVTQLSDGSPSRAIDLPASVHGYVETPVYAKVAGYMKTINVDKGDHVKAGQVIAVIESPETDKQVSDARSYYWLQAVTDRRNQELVRQEVVAQQIADTSHATMLQAKAAYEQELALQGYEIVRAPFDGIVTARYVDPGALIPQSTAPQSTAPSTSNSPIVALATMSPLRVYAYVPQSLSPFIKDGDPAMITVSEFPKRRFLRHGDASSRRSRPEHAHDAGRGRSAESGSIALSRHVRGHEDDRAGRLPPVSQCRMMRWSFAMTKFICQSCEITGST